MNAAFGVEIDSYSLTWVNLTTTVHSFSDGQKTQKVSQPDSYFSPGADRNYEWNIGGRTFGWPTVGRSYSVSVVSTNLFATQKKKFSKNRDKVVDDFSIIVPLQFLAEYWKRTLYTYIYIFIYIKCPRENGNKTCYLGTVSKSTNKVLAQHIWLCSP